MKLKLSTLLIIIGLIFVGYYYFVAAPCKSKALSQPHSQPHSQSQQPQQFQPMQQEIDNGVTPIESFAVTSIDDDDYQVYGGVNAYNVTSTNDLAGNVRPDNVTHFDTF